MTSQSASVSSLATSVSGPELACGITIALVSVPSTSCTGEPLGGSIASSADGVAILVDGGSTVTMASATGIGIGTKAGAWRASGCGRGLGAGFTASGSEGSNAAAASSVTTGARTSAVSAGVALASTFTLLMPSELSELLSSPSSPSSSSRPSALSLPSAGAPASRLRRRPPRRPRRRREFPVPSLLGSVDVGSPSSVMMMSSACATSSVTVNAAATTGTCDGLMGSAAAVASLRSFRVS
ncbi:MAG: hypothetical protein BWZ07_02635 [Alphaproteobacteria bacterium ADurb.BinA280]|nr:MAG: hypothetical protein BWZ07_02635 [Alphaproteobacteria bacterium ADurb.BinA280]